MSQAGRNEQPVKRGQAMNRLDTFTDAAFAFAVAMLAISIDEVPGSYPELIEALKGAPAFIASFAILLLYWRAHQNWSDRYGLDDLPSVMLTAALIVVVMIYVYPLKIMFTAAFGLFSGGWFPSSFEIETARHFRIVVTIYGVGFALMSAIISALYLHARRCATRLQMSDREAFDTSAESLAWAIVAGWGCLSIALAWVLPGRWLSLSVWVYFGLIFFGPVFDVMQRRIMRRRFPVD